MKHLRPAAEFGKIVLRSPVCCKSLPKLLRGTSVFGIHLAQRHAFSSVSKLHADLEGFRDRLKPLGPGKVDLILDDKTGLATLVLDNHERRNGELLSAVPSSSLPAKVVSTGGRDLPCAQFDKWNYDQILMHWSAPVLDYHRLIHLNLLVARERASFAHPAPERRVVTLLQHLCATC